MLIRFNVNNFSSFNDNQEFSMIAGQVRNKSDRLFIGDSIKLIKFAAIYGANASGKSNLIKAMGLAKEIIVKKIPSNSETYYSKINIENKDKSTYFEFEIELDNKFYSYGFEILLSQKSIKSEWLYEIGKASEKEIFTRKVNEGTYSISKYIKNKNLLAKLKVYIDDVKSDDSILFLTILNRNKDNLYKEFDEALIFKQVFSWFDNNLDINYPNTPFDNSRYFFTDESYKQIANYLEAFGTGVCNVTSDNVSEEIIKEKLPKSMLEDIIDDLRSKKESILVRYRNDGFYLFELKKDGKLNYKVIKFNHGGDDDISFFLSEESDGTRRLIDLLTVLLNKSEDKVFVIDEIDRCLHPLLTRKFVEEFLKIAKRRKVQLIVTTHESQLMDFNLLRRDEIWLMDKNIKGESIIYSMDEFNARFDKIIVKAYLEGRYGGVPSFYDSLLEYDDGELK
jgi:AAA15 family ATPase/GTPase